MEITRPPDEFRPKKDPIPDAEKLEQKRQKLLQQLNDTDRELSSLNPIRQKKRRSILGFVEPEVIIKCTMHEWTRTGAGRMICSKCGTSRKSVYAQNYKEYQTNGKIPPPPPPPPAPEGPPNVLITEGKPSFPKGRIVPESPIVSKITSWLDKISKKSPWTDKENDD